MSETKIVELIEKVKKLKEEKRSKLAMRFCDRIKLADYNPDDRDIAIQMGIESGELTEKAI